MASVERPPPSAALQARLKIVQNIYVLVVFGLWLCEDITACCYMYCYFRNTMTSTK